MAGLVFAAARLLPLLLLLSAARCQSAPRVVCFFENWARYRQPLARFNTGNIPPHLCTHIHYVGANVDDEHLALGPLDGFADIIGGGYRDAVALRQHNPQLRVLLMVGTSAQSQQDALLHVASSAERRKQFAEAATVFLREHQFDGLDVDWKNAGAPAAVAALLEELRATFQQEGAATARRPLLLSADLPADPAALRADYDLARVMAAVDYANVLGYGYHSSSANITYHHAPLRAPPGAPPALAGRGVAATLQALRELGVDAGRLNLVAPTFGLTFRLASARRTGLFAPTAGAGAAGPLTASDGTLAVYEICDKTARRGWTPARPYPEALGPYATDGAQWVAYDDEATLRRKGRLARDSGLGGVAVWTMSLDDFRGFCSGRPFPMIRAFKAGFLGVAEDALPSTPAPPTTPAYDATDFFTCPGSGKYPAADCSQFYFCQEGKAQLLDCPTGETYDVQLHSCRPGALCRPRPPLTVASFGPTPTPAPPPRRRYAAPVVGSHARRRW